MPSFAPLRIPRVKPVAKRLKVLGVFFFATVMASVGVIAPTQREPEMHIVSGKARTKTTSTGAEQKWSTTKPVTIVLDGSLDELGPDARAAIRDAFGTWVASGASIPPLTIDNQKASGRAVRDGVNRIVVGPITLAGHEKDVAVTIGYADDRTGAIVEADMIFNSKYAFGTVDANDASKCNKDYDLQNIATHEAGHFFGLGEDAEDAAATMYLRSATCETNKRALTPPDREAMSGLYPLRAASDLNGGASGDDPSADGAKAGCGARIAPVTASRHDGAFAVLALGIAGAALRIRARVRARGSLPAAPARLRAGR